MCYDWFVRLVWYAKSISMGNLYSLLVVYFLRNCLQRCFWKYFCVCQILSLLFIMNKAERVFIAYKKAMFVVPLLCKTSCLKFYKATTHVHSWRRDDVCLRPYVVSIYSTKGPSSRILWKMFSHTCVSSFFVSKLMFNVFCILYFSTSPALDNICLVNTGFSLGEGFKLC